MGKFMIELGRGLKWLGLSLIALALVIALFCGCSWSIGWLIFTFLGLSNLAPIGTVLGHPKYLSVGATIFSFVLIFQTVTIIITIWVILAYGRAVKKVST